MHFEAEWVQLDAKKYFLEVCAAIAAAADAATAAATATAAPATDTVHTQHTSRKYFFASNLDSFPLKVHILYSHYFNHTHIIKVYWR